MEWISVKDRLPDFNVSVLAWDGENLAICQLPDLVYSNGDGDKYWYVMNNEGGYLWEGSDCRGGIAEFMPTHWCEIKDMPKVKIRKPKYIGFDISDMNSYVSQYSNE